MGQANNARTILAVDEGTDERLDAVVLGDSHLLFHPAHRQHTPTVAHMTTIQIHSVVYTDSRFPLQPRPT